MPQHLKDLGHERKPYDEAHAGEKDYPNVYLTDEEVDALGAGSLDVGDERILMAHVRVSSKSAHDAKDGKHVSVSLELREGALGNMPNQSDADRAQAMFGGGGGGGQ